MLSVSCHEASVSTHPGVLRRGLDLNGMQSCRNVFEQAWILCYTPTLVWVWHVSFWLWHLCLSGIVVSRQ